MKQRGLGLAELFQQLGQFLEMGTCIVCRPCLEASYVLRFIFLEGSKTSHLFPVDEKGIAA